MERRDFNFHAHLQLETNNIFEIGEMYALLKICN